LIRTANAKAFLGCQNICPPVVKGILVGLELLLLLLQAPGGGYKLPLELFLIQRVFGDNKILGSKAILLFGSGEIVAVLGIVEVLGLTPVFMPFRSGTILLKGGVVAEFFHVIRSVLISGVVGITFPAPSPSPGSPFLASAFGRLRVGVVAVLLGGAILPGGAILGGVDHINVVSGGGCPLSSGGSGKGGYQNRT
jgi:hypothetical protein